MKSPAVRLAHGLQLAISWASVAVAYAQPAGAAFFMNSYAMKPLPLFLSRSQAKYSQSWLVLASRAV